LYSAVDTGAKYDANRLYWYKVDTSKMDGGVVQMVTGSTPSSSSSSREAEAFACYVTDKGSVYCGGDSWYEYNWLPNILPNSNSHLGNNGGSLYSAVDTGAKYDANRLYWYKVDTSKLDSSSSGAGRTITITGSKLSKVTGVYIDSNKNGQLDTSTDAQCTNLSIKSDSELTCTAPQLSPGTYNLFVVNASNQTMVPNALTYR